MLIADIPETLQHHFEHTAHLLYQTDSVKQALVEAIELWLAQHRNPVIEAEARANNQAYQTLKAELEQKYLGKWIVIAHGQLQGVGDSIMELNHLSSDAHHRIVMQVGQQYSKKVELGWQIAFN